MLEKLQAVEERFEELNRLMADTTVATDPRRLRQYAQEQAELDEVVQIYRRYRDTSSQLAQTREMLDDSLEEEMLEMVRQEVADLEARERQLYERLKVLLLPKDPNDEKDVIVEIRAGTGGEEAALFAADLYRMYSRYAELHGWSADLLSTNQTGIGGFKEVIFAVQGQGAYSRFKYESGVHRVQRVPATEASGRIHTSTATVAVLPEAEEVEVEISHDDLRIDVYKSAGAGGQNVQKNATAVRITHLPSGMVVACQDERSQHQNRESAMKILRARLYAIAEEKRLEERGETRRSQVGSGERSEKIRTYNYPQNRVTDHRIGLTSHRLEEVMDGAIDEFIDELATTEQAEKLQTLGGS
jgi:peptide chain release factor 1